MNLEITGQHMDITDALREYTTQKVGKITRHLDEVIDIHVILSVEKLRQKAEATVNIKGNTLFADATEEDMYAALDMLIDKLDRQVIKHKEKQKDHYKKDRYIS